MPFDPDSDDSEFDNELVFRTDDATRWGTGKGANLTPTEVDLNFWDLLVMIHELHENPALPLEIQSISVSGNQMTITMSDSVTHFGPFTLPEASFTYTGDFEGGHTYHTFDVFTGDDGLYLVLIDHTSDSEFNPDASILAGPLYKLIMPFPNLFDIGFSFPGAPGTGIATSAAMFTYLFAHDAYLLVDLTDSKASVLTAPTADLTVSIQKNTTEIGTATIAAGATAATFVFAADVQFHAGDRLRVIRPAAIDATAFDLAITFAAKKGILS